MKIVTAFFDSTGQYKRLLNVFKLSAKKYMPKIDIEVIPIVPPEKSNHHFDTYYGFMPAAKYAYVSHHSLAIADCDLMFNGSITDVWEYEFDLAFTVRDKPKYNTGLWFCRATKKAKLFIKDWIDNTNMLIEYFYENEDIVNYHYGIDQASLAMTIEMHDDVKIKELPCQIWNAEQTNWRLVDHNTKVIHIKSGLRDLLLNNYILKKKHFYLRPIIDKWRAFDGNTKRS